MDNFFKDTTGEAIASGLEKQGITTPTDIQRAAIGEIMKGHDVIMTSQTGSGKTLAYLIPLLKKVDLAIKHPQAIVLAPTHELASQIYKQAESLSSNGELQIKCALIIGGANIKKQVERLKEKPTVIIGSAGRILELIDMRRITGHYVKTIVLDEVDRMLDAVNVEGVKGIIKTTLKDRQIITASATMSQSAEDMAKSITNDAVRISVDIGIPTEIEHMVFMCEKRDKIELLRKIVHAEKIEKAIVFLNNQRDIEVMASRLNYHHIKSAALYGQALSKERKAALEDFRKGNVTLLVSSDLGSRGLDIEGITHVISLDIPEDPVFYAHRAGRTGRMGGQGVSICIATAREMQFIKKYEKSFGITIQTKTVEYGNIR